jgi:hypothetical protein
MVGDREERGCWTEVKRRMCVTVAVLIAAVAVAAVCEPAVAASGGASVLAAKHKLKVHRSIARHGAGFALARRAMWIWELQFVDGGNLGSIISDAHRWGIGTLMIKSSDGDTFWGSQFTPQIVAALHRGGLKVCAWQYVYGNHPITEAYKGAEAVKDGADCLLIDAEAQYEGKYVSAQSYMRRLRLLIGPRYPVALASFPYIDFHPGFPYSVFLGPGAAQYNVPQMYWKAIGTSTDGVFAHTYVYNTIYRRRIYPLGQVYSHPPGHQIFRFRQLSRAYGATGVSWWDWRGASARGWNAVSRPAGSLQGYVPDKVMASIGKGAKGDLVVWAQEHLLSAGYTLGVDGGFGRATKGAVLQFQAAHGLTTDGIIGPQTWGALLRYRTPNISWQPSGTFRRAAVASAATVRRDIRVGAPVPEPVPQSATRPQKRDEVAGAGGAGRPRGR